MPAGLTRTIGLCFVFALVTGAANAQSSATLEVEADAATRSLLRDAESMLGRSDPESAWRLLSPRESELAGNPYFDYLLGIAALDSGRRSEAIFSLQRALAVEPRFSGARMELARAYFESGNREQARPLFVTLLDENPPPGVRDVLLQYIAAIDDRPARPRARFSWLIEGGGGYDSNANGSTSNQQFLGFTLSPDNVAIESPFAEIAAGLNWTVPTSNTAAWYLGGRASHRHNTDASFIDASYFSALTGFSWRAGRFFGRAGVDGYIGMRDQEHNEWYAGGDLLLGSSLTDRFDLSLGVRGGAHRYDVSIDTLDVDRVLYTLAGTYRISALSSIRFEAIGGDDDAQQPGSPYGNSKAGGRISLNAPLGNAYLFASIGTLTSDYDGLFFGQPREDDQLSSILQLDFRDVFTDGLSIIPRLRYIDNDSDVALYKYDRTEFGLLVRWVPQ
ncbi:MAG: tetratricopeptide repeat protein [Woeseiaceae bacterium]|nr:tetratricopeptide repeat protein [Woeseiaceae bacterium]